MAYRVLELGHEIFCPPQLVCAAPRATRHGGCVKLLKLSVVQAQRPHSLQIDQLLIRTVHAWYVHGMSMHGD